MMCVSNVTFLYTSAFEIARRICIRIYYIYIYVDIHIALKIYIYILTCIYI